MSYPKKILEALKQFKDIHPDATLQDGIDFVEELADETEEETVDCPIHGEQVGTYCPRC